jgi:tetratricopeptide (TPR) repeat protein
MEMNTRTATIGGAVLLLLAMAGGAAWYMSANPALETAESADEEAPMPIPPAPPRLASGDRYERCFAQIPDDPEGAADYAESWATAGGGDGAAHCLALARVALGDTADGAGMLDKLAASSHAPAAARATVFAQATQAWMVSGDFSRALASATQALSLSPDDPDLLIDRAGVDVALGRPKNAVDDLTRALEIDPRRPDALAQRAAALRALERIDQAQDDVDRALSLDPGNPEALLERGIIRQRRNDQTGARRDWERAIALAPDTQTADLAQQNISLLDAGPERQ